MGEIGVPESQHRGVEQDRDDGGDRYVDGGGQSDGGGEEDVDGVLAVVQRIPESDRRNDSRQTECQSETVLNEHDDSRDDEREYDEEMHDRLLISAFSARQHVDPRDGNGEEDRRDHGEADGERQIELSDVEV